MWHLECFGDLLQIYKKIRFTLVIILTLVGTSQEPTTSRRSVGGGSMSPIVLHHLTSVAFMNQHHFDRKNRGLWTIKSLHNPHVIL